MSVETGGAGGGGGGWAFAGEDGKILTVKCVLLLLRFEIVHMVKQMLTAARSLPEPLRLPKA